MWKIPALLHIETIDLKQGINTNIQQVVSLHEEENIGILPMLQEILDSNNPIPDASFWKFLKQATPDEEKILKEEPVPEIKKEPETIVDAPKEEIKVEEIKKDEPIIPEQQVENKEKNIPLEENPIKEENNLLPKKSLHEIIESTNDELKNGEENPLSLSLRQPDFIEEETDNKQEEPIDDNPKEEDNNSSPKEIEENNNSPKEEEVDNNSQKEKEEANPLPTLEENIKEEVIEKEKSIDNQSKEESEPKEEEKEVTNPIIKNKDTLENQESNEVKEEVIIKENNDLSKKTPTEIFNNKENNQTIKEETKKNDIKIPSKIDINTTEPDKVLKELRETNVNNASEEAKKACNCCIIF